jgi:hypothetical protein
MSTLQTDADRARVVEGLVATQSASQAHVIDGCSGVELGQTVARAAPQWFVMRSVYLEQGAQLLSPRWTISYMKGPMTGGELRRARELAQAR